MWNATVTDFALIRGGYKRSAHSNGEKRHLLDRLERLVHLQGLCERLATFWPDSTRVAAGREADK